MFTLELLEIISFSQINASFKLLKTNNLSYDRCVVRRNISIISLKKGFQSKCIYILIENLLISSLQQTKYHKS